MMSGWEESVA